MRSDHIKRIALFVSATVLTAGAVVVGGGCARTSVSQSLVDTNNQTDQELEYFVQLEEQGVVSNNDALHTLFLLADQKDPHQDYAQRSRQAALRGWLPDHKIPPADESARVGMIAVAMVDILDIEGGLSLRMFHDSPRYATRELVFMGLLPPRTENQSITGLELIDLVGRADRHLASK